uniref:Uncharacterized protein n=1 Tax=uncultured organism TaxID=155900 RepID=D8VN34_9ZZZZ|nr:hypothetical protein [uncultured organism]
MQVHGAAIVLREKQLVGHAHLYLYIVDMHSVYTDMHSWQVGMGIIFVRLKRNPLPASPSTKGRSRSELRFRNGRAFSPSPLFKGEAGRGL